MALQVDVEWGRRVLSQWIAAARSAMSDPDVSYADVTEETLALRTMENQTARVVQAVLGRTSIPSLMQALPGSLNVVELQQGIDLASYALGILDTEAETNEHITGTTAPSMSADGFHPVVWKGAEALWVDGHHGPAVQRAATFLNAHIQDLCSRHDVSDTDLMRQAFSLEPPQAGKPRLRWPGNDDDLTVKAMRSGLLQLSQGCFQAIRNPATHGTKGLSEQVALEHLATLSTLARWTDECELIVA